MEEAIEALVGQGIQTLVAPDADKREEPRPGRRYRLLTPRPLGRQVRRRLLTATHALLKHHQAQLAAS